MSPPRANPSTLLARALIDAVLAAGVRELVLAPGSRNAPLAFAAWDAASLGRCRLHTRIDERSAGFLGLGLGLGASTSRAAVICTSGTAVANLHPAVLEAAHAGVPLVLLTADRPASLRGTGSSQTTDQVRIFGAAAEFFDVAAEPDLEPVRSALARGGGPTHVNVQFAPPLVPDQPWLQSSALQSSTPGPVVTRSAPAPAPVALAPGPRTVVVAGDGAGPAARRLAEAGNWPLLAEPTSGARTGDNAIRTYRLLLDGSLGERIERVVVAGHPTLSRPVTALLGRTDVEVCSVREPGFWGARPFPVATEAAAFSAEPDDPAWLEEWRAADRVLAAEVDRLLADEGELTPWHVAAAVGRAVPPGGLLFVGASSPIRDLDLMARPWPVGERRKVVANRGLAGIDGTVSSAIGAALARPPGARNLALMGDVTFLHDAGGLVAGPREARPDLSIVVVNDDGGSIFTVLEQGAAQYAAQYDDLFGTPHGVDLAALCAATRTPHWRVESLPELEQALTSPNGGVEVIEVRVRRDNRRAIDARFRALAGPQLS
ncbi:2-succinyl-5-enolpyruvyl-6-hydroxy-3-cyclohexene-1-carboxylic-acid synthase [Nocardioides sp. AE5]|uniref:2-succinyl-5-enolpyruvyl-6-hydroxy-3- cyclohexene-1-carboxylic-acid synthase n=1 Tax=Nocardioides sp. AE5 TaxID=2962573 RepID=UPI002882AA55|nr:2-succinyl-5-enolpyruvyl-6-hydroxy-3-cyclohexene-1-carboxylic-acid synthase [Nocardioides sp. AE5]MDT0200662.1 2-succinyl-5-enolpyruvyl-6-hydroxy-3-cyclohexene-1-carboxylic-acid synthase [Nocardioides sp. AE5]